MTYIEKLFPPGARLSARKAKRTVVGTLVASFLVAMPLCTSATASAAGGQEELAALRAQISAGATEIHALTENFADASLQAASLTQQLHAQYAQLRTLRRRLARGHATLEQAALQSYTSSGEADLTGRVAASTNPAIGAEYVNVASGDVSSSIDAYELEQRQVATAIDAITSEQKATHADEAEAASARVSALARATSEQNQLTALEAELAAQKAAAPAADATQGLPVNHGLVDVTRSETSATTPATAPPTTSTSPTTAPPTTAPPTTTPPTAPPTTTPPSSGGGAGGVWLELRTCESGDNYQENTGNGFYGAYQFSASTWSGLGYPGLPYQEPPSMQDAAAMRLQAASGWGQWPACAAALGLT